ncbi:MAG: hypothetical protein J1E38_03895 [Paramuribaculum sp.]|nr:hypothetical protein [Paramuribaculum sp.]
MKIQLIFLFFIISFLSTAKAQSSGLPGPTIRSGVYFNNNELKIDWEAKLDAWMAGEKEYEKAWLIFYNKTNSRIRVKYSCQAYLVRYNVKFNYTKTIIIPPQGRVIDEVISNYKNLHYQHESICNIQDFKLINYAVEPVNYRTDW